MDAQAIRELIKEKYGEAAARAKTGGSSCCGAAPALMNVDPITSNLYSDQECQGVPADAVAASLGCGNPTALAELQDGETVLDLGSGGGIDVLLSAKRVGPKGKAYGLDMTDEMLALARENQRTAGVENVEFLKGEIENIPLPDGSVDVIISNCVVNLSGEKERVLAEAFRVPTGRAPGVVRYCRARGGTIGDPKESGIVGWLRGGGAGRDAVWGFVAAGGFYRDRNRTDAHLPGRRREGVVDRRRSLQ